MLKSGFSVSSFRIRTTLIGMAGHFKKVSQTRGLLDIVLRLKVAAHVVLAYSAGNPIKDTRPLGVTIGLSKGLPSFLPVSLRNDIRNGNIQTIRWVVSMIYAYKAIKVTGKLPDLNTIENKPFKGDVSEIASFMPQFFRIFLKGNRRFRFPTFYDRASKASWKVPFSIKSGPNFHIALLGPFIDALAWLFSGTKPLLDHWLKVTGQVHISIALDRTIRRILGITNVSFIPQLSFKKFLVDPIYKVYNTLLDGDSTSYSRPKVQADVSPTNTGVREVHKLLKELFGIHSKKAKRTVSEFLDSLSLGKLALKQEAAGKTRTFALVDWWTQMSLYPLHLFLFSILKSLETDGTFDQNKAVDAFASEHKGKKIFSFDLSAATDNIPIALTVAVFSYLLGPAQAEAWKKLIVNRDFKVPKGTTRPEGSKIRYGRGQPIGALSSWAALALTHHVLVQLSASRVNQFPFSDYRVLGDDIVIAGNEVADSYLQVCKDYEVPINNKGILSDITGPMKASITHFANQVKFGDIDASPISLKEEVKVLTLSQRAESLMKLVNRGILDVAGNSLLPSVIRGASSRLGAAIKNLASLTRGEIPDAVRSLLASLFIQGLSPTGVKEPVKKGVILKSLLIIGVKSLTQLAKTETLVGDRKLSTEEIPAWQTSLLELTKEMHGKLDSLENTQVLASKLERISFFNNAGCFEHSLPLNNIELCDTFREKVAEDSPFLNLADFSKLDTVQKLAYLNQDALNFSRSKAANVAVEPSDFWDKFAESLRSRGPKFALFLHAFIRGDFRFLDSSYRVKQDPNFFYFNAKYYLEAKDKGFLSPENKTFYLNNVRTEEEFTLGEILDVYYDALEHSASLDLFLSPMGSADYVQYLMDTKKASLKLREDGKPIYMGSSSDPSLSVFSSESIRRLFI